jgi:RNA-directed DNA polymerase
MRVEEDGESEGHSVAEWIGIASSRTDNIIPRESGQTSIWSFITRKLEKPSKETKQMTVAQTTGAVPHETVDWHAIDWAQVHRNVRRLQARIVKATQEGKWGKVKALQHLLTHSFSAKALAVKRVTENQGKRTPGVDKEVWDTPQKKARAVEDLRQRGYRPQPLRRIYIDKANGKKRPLGIPTMRDRAMQALYLLALDPISETLADQHSYGFRKERSTADAIEHCFTALSRQNSAQWVLEGDIKGCFDHLSHEWLIDHIPMDKTILRKWLAAGYIEKDVFHQTEEGTPQGGIISPVLANMALDGLQGLLAEHFPKLLRRSKWTKVNFIRYADDWVITGYSRDLLENEVKPLVEQFLRERGLTLSPDKTHVTHIETGFDFLGQNVRKYNGKLLIKPSKKNVKRFLKEIRDLIRNNKQAPAGLLIILLNPRIRGWAQYHQHVVSKTISSKVDSEIYHALWRWAKRRHPKKNRRWIRRKYFKTVGNQHWVFSGEYQGKEWQLLKAASLPIRRHIKVKGDANPYDPDWEIYFEKRLGVKMANNLRGRKQLLYLWREQNGICPICQQKITKLTGWHNHHIIWRSLGGSDKAENRVLLHPNCHQQVHSQGLYVEKPRPSRGVREA